MLPPMGSCAKGKIFAKFDSAFVSTGSISPLRAASSAAVSVKTATSTFGLSLRASSLASRSVLLPTSTTTLQPHCFSKGA